jgi:hypothetical protein
MREQPYVALEPPAVPLAVPEELLLLVESAAPMENDDDIGKMSGILLWDTA